MMSLKLRTSSLFGLVVRLALVMALIGLAGADLGNPSQASASETTTVTAARTDTGVVDRNRDGRADNSNYGARNRALSVGEQGGDGRNLRFVTPFRMPGAARSAVKAGSRAKLSFSVWRADALAGRRLVITALPGGLQGKADFNRAGIEVYRAAPTTGRMTIDVTAAVKATTTSTITFRFATDTPPAKGDDKKTQINIATANGRSSTRPKLTVTSVAKAPKPAPAPAPAGMSLVFADEFNSTSLNTGVWKPYHSTYGDGNHELQCHTPNNVAVSNGTLKITARRGTVTCPNGAVRNFSSGFLGTRETGTYFPRYGRFEIRAKVPHGQGLWPAFWLRHRNGASTAEVDIMEYFHSQVPGKTTGTLHLDGHYNISKKTTHFEAPTTTPGWHTWAVDIQPASTGVKFTFLLDGNAYHTYTDTQRHWASQAPTDGLWDIAVNLSVGGNWVGHPDTALGYLPAISICAQRGTTPTNCTTTGIRRAAFPAPYEIDYIHVYKTN
jgi:beta-glucanase (GH16 family)